MKDYRSNYPTLHNLIRDGHFDSDHGGSNGEATLRIEVEHALTAGRLSPDEAQSLLLELRLRRVAAARSPLGRLHTLEGPRPQSPFSD